MLNERHCQRVVVVMSELIPLLEYVLRQSRRVKYELINVNSHSFQMRVPPLLFARVSRPRLLVFSSS